MKRKTHILSFPRHARGRSAFGGKAGIQTKGCHPEFISGTVFLKRRMLKQVQHDDLFMILKKTDVPRLYESTYKDKVDSFLLVYQPLAKKGLSVLNKEAAYLFSLIDGKKTLGEIHKKAISTSHMSFPRKPCLSAGRRESRSLARNLDPRVKPENDKYAKDNFTFQDLQKVFKDFEENEIVYCSSEARTKALDFSTDVSKNIPSELGVWLHLTNQCNLRCKYCYVFKNEQKMSQETARNALKKIIKNAVDHQFKKVTIKFSGGEALLELLQLVQLAQFAKSLAQKEKIAIDFVVLTNGTLITEKVAKILKENNLRASVSLDGLEKYNDQNRVFVNGAGSFKLVEKGITALQKEKVLFNISVTVTASNLENVPELTKYLLLKNLPFVFNFYRENPLVHEDLENDNQKMIKYLKQAYAIIGENLPKYSLINGLLDRVSFKRPHLRACGMGRNYIIVGHKGTLHCCQMTLNKAIGSIEDQDLIKTMQKGDFTKGISVENKTPCRTCRWKYVCCGGCPLLTFSQKGSYAVNTPYCQVYKALIPELLRLEAKRLIKYQMV